MYICICCIAWVYYIDVDIYRWIRCLIYTDGYGVWYGVATISRLLKIIGLFCRISSLLLDSFAKETYNFKEPTNRRHPICVWLGYCWCGIGIYIYAYIHTYMVCNIYIYIYIYIHIYIYIVCNMYICI